MAMMIKLSHSRIWLRSIDDFHFKHFWAASSLSLLHTFFLWMMVLDGCFIVKLLRIYGKIYKVHNCMNSSSIYCLSFYFYFQKKKKKSITPCFVGGEEMWRNPFSKHGGCYQLLLEIYLHLRTNFLCLCYREYLSLLPLREK